MIPVDDAKHLMFWGQDYREPVYTKRTYVPVTILTTGGEEKFYLDTTAGVLTNDPEGYEKSLHLEPLRERDTYYLHDEQFAEDSL